MSLARLLTIDVAHFAPRYAACSAEHPEFAAYPTLPALVERFADPKNKDGRERNELVCAVVRAYRQTHDRLWTSILVAAFLPRLQTANLYGADADEREALFFAALFRIVDKVDLVEKAPILDAVLWRSAKKALVRKLKVHAAWNEIGFGEEVDETLDGASTLSQPLLAAWFLSRRGGDRPDLDLVVRAAEWGSLRAFVASEFPDVPGAERETLYRRLRKRRRKSVAELRALLGGRASAKASVDADVSRPGDTLVAHPVTPRGNASVARYVTRYATRDERVAGRAERGVSL